MESKSLFRKNLVYHIIMCSLLIAGAVLLLAANKETVMLFANSHFCTASDIYFRYYTQLPEVTLIVFVCVYAALRKMKWLIAAAVAFAAGGLFIAAGKFLFFSGFPRPVSYLSNPKILHIVEGITLHTSNSFPSGHTLSAFTGFTLLAFMSRYTLVKLLCLALACLVGFSRMYLGQHFFMDVYAGAFAGYVIATLAFTWFDRVFKTPVWEKPLIRI